MSQSKAEKQEEKLRDLVGPDELEKRKVLSGVLGGFMLRAAEKDNNLYGMEVMVIYYPDGGLDKSYLSVNGNRFAGGFVKREALSDRDSEVMNRAALVALSELTEGERRAIDDWRESLGSPVRCKDDFGDSPEAIGFSVRVSKDGQSKVRFHLEEVLEAAEIACETRARNRRRVHSF